MYLQTNSKKGNNTPVEVEAVQSPSFEIFGTTVHLPPSSSLNTILLLALLVQNLTSLFKTKPVEFAIDLLRGGDLELLEKLDDIAVELRELTKADRVLIAGFHNGKKNTVYHWKRLSVLAEATRLGIEPVASKLKDVDTYSVMTKADYDLLSTLKAHQQYVHTHQDLPTISAKQKRFLSTCYMFGQYVCLLVDDIADAPHGIIFVQYDSREKCEVQTENEVGWSDTTRDIAYQKAMVVNNLIYDRGTSRMNKIFDFVKKKLRIF
jgi:hypothetical protein